MQCTAFSDSSETTNLTQTSAPIRVTLDGVSELNQVILNNKLSTNQSTYYVKKLDEMNELKKMISWSRINT